MAATKKAPALRERQRKKLDEELDSGSEVDQRRDDIMRRMLASPPKPHTKMKIGDARPKESIGVGTPKKAPPAG